MRVDELVTRARSQIGKGTVYRLGGGNLDPSAPHPRDEQESADCSAFACWAIGIRKYQPQFRWLVAFNGGWYNTGAVWRDADVPIGLFEMATQPYVGCLMVYPSVALARTHLRGVRRGPSVGHVGVVTEARGGKATRVVHCSSGNFRRTGDAIRETDAAVFERVAYSRYVWCATVER